MDQSKNSGCPQVRRRTVAIAGGGTAGHVTPGISIMSAYRDLAGADVYFVACSAGFERDLVLSRGFPLKTIPGHPYARENPFGKVRALFALTSGILAARKLLKACPTDLVIGLGGYASAGTLMAARLLGIRTAIHEANVLPGIANKLLARLVDRVFVGWEQTRGAFHRNDIVVTGTPVLPQILEAAAFAPSRHNRGMYRVLVTGGSLGSSFLNRQVPALLARVRDQGLPLTVRHQTGHGLNEVRESYNSFGLSASVEAFIPSMIDAYRESDFVIATAGAVTLAELAALGLPSLLVPLAAAADGHQVPNAKAYGGIWVAENDWDLDRLAESITDTLRNATGLAAESERLRQLARPHAAQQIVELCEALFDDDSRALRPEMERQADETQRTTAGHR